MIKRGKMTYVPPIIIDELEDIRREDCLINNADAFKELCKYARVGREAKRIITLDWSKAKKLPPLDFNIKKRRKGDFI